jgi:CBS domain-containing protein
MRLQEILMAKGTEVHTIGPAASLDDVVQELVRYNIGSLIVCEPASKGTDVRILGIITERDILRAQAAHRAPLEKLTVASVMSTRLVTAAPEDHILEAMRLMTHYRIRHLPIVVGEQLFGVISIGDIVKAHHDELEMENHYMKSYIQGESGEIATPLD